VTPVQRSVRILGLLFLVTAVCGGFGEGYVPGKIIVAGNGPATMDNVAAHEMLFRAGFAAYLAEAMCDVAIALIFYALLRPVQKDLSLAAAFFGLVGTAIYAIGEASLMTMLVRHEAARFAQLLFAYAGEFSLLFYGVATTIRGYLIYRSQYFPKWLGVLLCIAGVSFASKTYTFVLAPAYSSDFLLAPMFVSLLAMIVWFLTKGVDVEKWDATVHESSS